MSGGEWGGIGWAEGRGGSNALQIQKCKLSLKLHLSGCSE